MFLLRVKIYKCHTRRLGERLAACISGFRRSRTKHFPGERSRLKWNSSRRMPTPAHFSNMYDFNLERGRNPIGAAAGWSRTSQSSCATCSFYSPPLCSVWRVTNRNQAVAGVTLVPLEPLSSSKREEMSPLREASVGGSSNQVIEFTRRKQKKQKHTTVIFQGTAWPVSLFLNETLNKSLGVLVIPTAFY